MLFVTALAFPVVLLPALIAAILISYANGNYLLCGSFLAVLLSLGVNSLLKLFLHRSRPDTLYVGAMKFKTFSFPSGHAFGAVVTYGFLAYLLMMLVAPISAVLIAIVAVMLMLVIGVSRIYLGAHFPTDVLGGWLLGLLSLFLIIYYLKPVV